MQDHLSIAGESWVFHCQVSITIFLVSTNRFSQMGIMAGKLLKKQRFLSVHE